MGRQQINVRVSSEILEKVDRRGRRSDVVRQALEKYLSDEGVYQSIDVGVDKKLDLIDKRMERVEEAQKDIIARLEAIKNFQPIIHVHYPESMLPVRAQTSLPEKRGFWSRLFKRE